METQQNFDKLFGRINGVMEMGKYTVYVQNFTDISKMQGVKEL
jgi:hypothetical protein